MSDTKLTPGFLCSASAYRLEKCRPQISGMCWWRHADYIDLATLWAEATALIADGLDVRIVLRDRDVFEEAKADREERRKKGLPPRTWRDV